MKEPAPVSQPARYFSLSRPVRANSMWKWQSGCSPPSVGCWCMTMVKGMGKPHRLSYFRSTVLRSVARPSRSSALSSASDERWRRLTTCTS
jgi:hypothetical protein